MKKIALLFLMLLALMPTVSADDFLTKKQVKLGQPVADFTLQDLEGKAVKLSDYKGKPVMIHFWSAQCPFVVRYDERLKAIASVYKDKAGVIGIDSNVTENVKKIKKEARKRGVNYPILLDPDSKIADQFGAITTPHIYVLDGEGKLVYEGAVDDQGWSEKGEVKTQYARQALDEVIAGKPVSVSESKTVGCTVKRKK